MRPISRHPSARLGPELCRRDAMVGLGAVCALPFLGLAWRADASQPIATPPQPEGPYYPIEFPADVDSDLIRIRGTSARAVGEILYLGGRVMDLRGRDIDGATVAIWQCDQHGFYHHSRDRVRNGKDVHFQGYGRARTDQRGVYRFRTIVPTRYPGRTPHIHVRVEAPGFKPLITQMYNAAEARSNRADAIYGHLASDAARKAVTVSFSPGRGIEPGAVAGRFDIVLS